MVVILTIILKKYITFINVILNVQEEDMLD